MAGPGDACVTYPWRPAIRRRRVRIEKSELLSEDLNMSKLLARLLTMKRDERGVTALEYGLIAALIATVIIGAVTTLGTNLSGIFTKIAGSI
jgi:pilus assembly protein Flp/PilA